MVWAEKPILEVVLLQDQSLELSGSFLEPCGAKTMSTNYQMIFPHLEARMRIRSKRLRRITVNPITGILSFVSVFAGFMITFAGAQVSQKPGTIVLPSDAQIRKMK